MSLFGKNKTWVAPAWWPRNKENQPITGFSVTAWCWPEPDQIKLDYEKTEDDTRVFSLGPVRIHVKSIGINRQYKI